MPNVYEIALPHETNSKSRAYVAEREAWERRALKKAGGYTDLGERVGAWRGDEGTVYRETMHWYQVATSPDVMGQLMQDAFRLFPDQEAIYLAKLGTAEIVSRDGWAIAAPILGVAQEHRKGMS